MPKIRNWDDSIPFPLPRFCVDTPAASTKTSEPKPLRRNRVAYGANFLLSFEYHDRIEFHVLGSASKQKASPQMASPPGRSNRFSVTNAGNFYSS